MTETRVIAVAGVEVQLQRKAVKHLRLVVKAPDGAVRVSAPRRVSEAEVRALVLEKLPWIKKHQAKFRSRPGLKPLSLSSGEVHQVFGEPYRLEVIEQTVRPQVVLRSDTLQMKVRPGAGLEVRQRLLDEWYRQQLKQRLPDLIEKWEPIIGERVAEWGVKKMKTRWGSCNIQKRRIWLSLMLARKPEPCLEYVLVHEMVHLLERYHNARFYGFMDNFLPQWRQYEALLSE